MRKNKILNKLLSVLILSFLILGCSEDEQGSASVDFASVGSGFLEADGDATVIIPFRNAPQSISADDLIFSGQATEGEDYEILGVTEEGVEIQFFDDSDAENNETLRITIDGNPAGNYIHQITLVSDDPGYMDIELQWADGSDLDLYSLFYNEEIEDWEVIDFSDPGNTLDPIDWTDEDGMYGFSYNYYGGSNDALNFSSVFTPTGVTLEGGSDALTFNAMYTLANKDPNSFQVEQTCVKTGAAFTDFSDIEVPETGSREHQDELVLKMRRAIARYKQEHSK